MKVGFIPDPRDVNVTPLADVVIQVKTDMKRKGVLYLSHHENPRVVEGWSEFLKKLPRKRF
jgi:hypothetical protein